MAKMKESFIERVKTVAAQNIVEIIDRRVKLKKAGASFKACCPFHEDKNPSFSVDPSEGKFRCFTGCEGSGGGGNAVDFIIRYERLEFPEAIKSLAHELGVGPVEYMENPEEVKRDAQEVKQAIAMKAALVAASSMYSIELSRDTETLRYLLGRGVTANDISEFNIGVTPKTANAITSELSARFSHDVLKAASLSSEDEGSGRKYDTFRNRLMFPVRNIKGDIVAFGGRRLDGEKQAKYINSATSVIFNKSATLYGLYESVKMPGANITRGVFDLTEGYMDVIAGHRYGFTNTVAGLGTSVTEDHIKMLFQRCDKIRLVQDGDEAGIESMKKAIKVAAPFLTPDKTITAVLLPDGEDIDSVLSRAGGVDAYKKLLSNELPMSEFIVKYLIGKNADTAEGQSKVAAEVNEIIGLICDENLKMTMRSTLYRYLGVTPDQVTDNSTPQESPSALFAKLNPAMQKAIQSVPKAHLVIAGLILKIPAWEKLLQLSDPVLEQLPKSSIELMNLCRGNGKIALTNASHPAHGLMRYLSSNVPQDVSEQVEIVAEFNETAKTLHANVEVKQEFSYEQDNSMPDEYEEYAKTSVSMSN